MIHLKEHNAYTIIGGSDCCLYTACGRELLDLTSMSFTASMGYNNAEIKAAAFAGSVHIAAQSAYRMPLKEKHAAEMQLRAPMPEGLVDYCLHGSVAVEGAIKIAWEHTGRKDVVVVRGSFHGKTALSYSLSHMSDYTEDFVHPVGMNNIAEAEEVISAVKPACVLFELIQGNGGGGECTQEFVDTLAEQARKAGALVIVDEIQTGAGRCGTHFFHSSSYNLVPDIVTFGKALGAGYPIFGTISRKDLTLDRAKHSFTSTYVPEALSASLKFLELCDQKMLQEVHRKGEFVKERLDDVIGQGLMLQINTASPQEASYLADKLLELDIITTTTKKNGYGKAIKIKPPYIISEEELQRVIDSIIDLREEYNEL